MFITYGKTSRNTTPFLPIFSNTPIPKEAQVSYIKASCSQCKNVLPAHNMDSICTHYRNILIQCCAYDIIISM